MDVRLGRSKNQFICILLLSISNEQDGSFLPLSAYGPRLIEFKLGRSIIYSLFNRIVQILDIIVDKDPENALSPNSIEFKCGRSIHYQ